MFWTVKISFVCYGFYKSVAILCREDVSFSLFSVFFFPHAVFKELLSGSDVIVLMFVCVFGCCNPTHLFASLSAGVW